MLTLNVCKSFRAHLKLRGQEQGRRIEMNIPVFWLLSAKARFSVGPSQFRTTPTPSPTPPPRGVATQSVFAWEKHQLFKTSKTKIEFHFIIN